jgi:DNA (cytosine-5)-methyltransferase 1
MAPLRGTTTIPAPQLANLTMAFPTRATKTAVGRLQSLGLRGRAGHDDEAVELACRFRPAERDLYRLLLDTDMLLTSQAATRVAARVCGTESETRNRLSNGRLDMARLVGAGSDAPLRMAALHLIGSTLCRPQASLCGQCPLRDFCISGDPSVAPA